MARNRGTAGGTAAQLREFERIDGTPIVIAPFATPDEALKPLAIALRFELLHDLSRALAGSATTDHRPVHPTDFLLDGAFYRTETGWCATLTLRELNAPNVIWADRLNLSQSLSAFVMPQQARRIARGIVIAIRLAGARGQCDVAERAGLRAWAELWARPQTEASNGAALRALASVPRSQVARSPALAAYAYAQWRASRYGWNGVDREAALRSALRAAHEAVERDPGDPDARLVLAMAQFPFGDGGVAEAHLLAAIAVDPSHAPAHGNLGFLLLRQGDLAGAKAACSLALAISPMEPLGIIWHASLSLVHAHEDDVVGARREAALAVAANPKHRFGWLAAAAAAGVAESHSDARIALDKLGSIGPADGFGPEMWPWCRPLLDKVRSIASLSRSAPALSRPRIRVVTLGDFRIERGGERLDWSRKAPRRPLEILKLLITHREEAVSAAMVMETLWPGEAGAHVRRRLDTALYRLRRILGDGAIRSANGSIGLSARDVEVDAHLFEREGDPASYTGTFLPNDLHVAWTIPMRESLRDRLQASLAERAEPLIADQRYTEALRLCEQGISHHPTGESLYRLAIRICRLAGWRSDGARIYERCRECLGRELGLRPSRATEDEYLRLIRE